MSTLFSPVREFIRKGDLILLSLCLAASGFGLLLIYSATRYQDNNKAILVQLIGILLGVIAYFLITFLDLQLFAEKNWVFLLGFSVVFILLLLTPFGKSVGGNLNWLTLDPIIKDFPINIQPNEVVKIPFILILALQLSNLQAKGDVSSIASVAQFGGFTLFMLALIAAVCGDMGMCVIYMMIFVIMAWSAGVKLRWFILVGGGIVAAVVIAWFFILPETSLWTDYRIMRFRVVFDHELDPMDKGFQQTRSILALGSGKLLGQGYMKGLQTQSSIESALPARHTDFIFSVCGEELGMVGCVILLLLLSSIVIRCIWIANQASTPFYAYVCMGMAGMLLFQIIFNVGMCLYVLPVMGLTLPFFSYGGTSVMTLFACMGIVSSVKAKTLPSWLRNH